MTKKELSKIIAGCRELTFTESIRPADTVLVLSLDGQI